MPDMTDILILVLLGILPVGLIFAMMGWFASAGKSWWIRLLGVVAGLVLGVVVLVLALIVTN